MDLRYIDWAGGNFSSHQPAARPATPEPRAKRASPAPPPEPSPSGAAEIAPAPLDARAPAQATAPDIAALPVPASTRAVPDKFDLVSIDDVHFDADQPTGEPVDVRTLFTSGEIPSAALVADIAPTAQVVPPTPALPAQEAPATAAPAPPAAPAQAKLAAKRAKRRAETLARQQQRRERASARAQRRAARPQHVDPSPEARRRYALAANLASALGLVAAVGASTWYFAGEHGRFARETRMSAAAAPPNPTAAATPAANPPRAALPRAPQAALLSIAAIESQTERRSFQQVVRIQRGEFFRDLLMRGGVHGAEAQLAHISLAGVYDVRKMRAGQLVTIDFGILGEEHNRFLGVRFDSNFDRTVSIQRQSRGDFVATEIKKEIVTQLLRSDGTIDHSVFQAGLQAGLPPEPVVRMINLFAFDVDFQRDVQKGDTFETLIEQHKDARGDVVRHGNILFAALTLQGQTIKLYRWQGDDGEIDYFSETGHSSRKALMRTPIDGARLSSGFGYRRHPILGYSKLHQGTDFAAPPGTPIYAAGSGQIERIGWQGGYGNAIMIRHNKEYQTLYGHMSGYAPGMQVGKRVKQGDIIGYVGSTGLSTGPHLHYEVHLNGRQIDPLSLKLPSRQRLQGQELARYLDYVKTLDQRFQALARSGATGQGLAAPEQEADTGCVNGARLDPTDKRACEQ